MKLKEIPLSIKILVPVIGFALLVSSISNLFTQFSTFYNQTVAYQEEFIQLEQNQITTFDNNYLAFQEKFKIADINKETFITVTQIIMSNRADGKNVAWKWMQENQQIPYNEFVKFYSDLSIFAENRFKENNSIERRKQQIAKENNRLLKSYPGIMYNYFLHRPQIVYKEGFVSDETRKLFKK